MSNKPLVSIIIPTYNYGHLIPETLDCLLNQTYTNWEAIIVDDGSTDNTKAVVQEYLKDARIKYIFQINKGLSEARNTGLHNVNGEYVAFLDADDLISQNKLEVQVAFMKEHPDVIISYTKALYFKNGRFGEFYKNLDLTNVKHDSSLSYNIDFKRLIESNFTPVNTPLIHSSFIKKHNIKFKTSLKALEDWDFWLQCVFFKAQFHYISDKSALAYIRVHEASMSTNRSYMYEWEIKLRKYIFNYIGDSNSTNKNELLKLNRRKEDILYRMSLRKRGILNFSNLSEAAENIGYIRVLKLAFKELNAIRRNK